MPEDTAEALTRPVEPAATKAPALPARNGPADEVPMVAAFLELGATPWSQEPERTEKAGQETVTMADLAATASEVTEREVRRFLVADDTDDQSRNVEVAQPVPATMADMLLAT